MASVFGLIAERLPWAGIDRAGGGNESYPDYEPANGLAYGQIVLRTFGSLCSLATSFPRGGIEDVFLGVYWEASTFANEVSRRAAVLSHMGIGRGSTVAIAHGGTAHFFADLFATWSVGATAACLDSTLTAREIQTVVAFASAAIVLVDSRASFGQLAAPIIELRSERSAKASPPSKLVSQTDPALLLFTSGTTGAPKGVVLTFGALEARIDANIRAIGKAPLARALVSLPTHFGHGLIGNSLTPLLAGGDIVLHPIGVPMANELGRIIDQHDITFMSSVPALWRMTLSRSSQPKRASLARVHVGSAPFPATLWSEVAAWTDAEVVNCYGTTETANWLAGASSRVDGIANGLVGSMWGGTAAVIDSNGAIQPVGSGEIIVRSPSQMSGYLHRPDLTAAALFQGWYRTGDSGSIDEQGRIWLTGRAKDEINRAGFKVQPAEIDALLEANPAIAEACVFGIEDPLGGEAIAAAVQLKQGAGADVKGLQSWCLERIRREAVPESWFFVSEIPRTARGKVNRDAVRNAIVKKSAAVADDQALEVAPGTISDQDVGALAETDSVRTAVEFAWTKVFGRDSYDVGISLSETEADSLDLMRFWLLTEQMLGTRLSMDVLDSEPKPDQLVAALEQQLRAKAEAPNAPLVFLMPPAVGDFLGLARFRAVLKAKIRFVLIQYPDWREMIKAGGGFDALASSAVAQICTKCPGPEPILLAGYSFGGLVAMEAARRLAERGRRVRFLGLIDTRGINSPSLAERLRRFFVPRQFFMPRQKEEFEPTTRRAGTEESGRLPSRWHALISALILISAFRTLRIFGRLAMLFPEKQAFTIGAVINWRLRTESLRRLRLRPPGTPLTLFRSDDSPSSGDYGWSALCPELTVIHTRSTHELMFDQPFVEILGKQFQDAVESVDVPEFQGGESLTYESQ
ncbi:AMP-binding protein [Bradyrhizobium sp.]|uniref:AMP-binding protein n=1 Tax=Bradyrhizobium sp. TaxID=376 RepID=UPI003C20F185